MVKIFTYLKTGKKKTKTKSVAHKCTNKKFYEQTCCAICKPHLDYSNMPHVTHFSLPFSKRQNHFKKKKVSMQKRLAKEDSTDGNDSRCFLFMQALSVASLALLRLISSSTLLVTQSSYYIIQASYKLNFSILYTSVIL